MKDSNGRTHNTPRPSPTAISRPADLQSRRIARELLGSLPANHVRQVQFEGGEIFVRAGDTIPDGIVLFVLEGALEERIEYNDPRTGHKAYVMRRVEAGSFALVQACTPEYANARSLFTIRAVEAGAAAVIFPGAHEELRRNETFITDVLASMFRAAEHNRLLNQTYFGLTQPINELLETAPNLRKLFDNPATLISALSVAYREREKSRAAEMETQLQLERVSVELIRAQEAAATEKERADQASLASAGHLQDLEEAEARNRELASRIAELEKQLEQASAEKRTARTDSCSLRAEMDELKATNERLQAFVETLKNGPTRDQVRDAFIALTEQEESARVATRAAERPLREAEAALQELETRMRLIHQAVEFLSLLNPEMEIREDVLFMLQGMEPPQSVASIRRQIWKDAHRDEDGRERNEFEQALEKSLDEFGKVLSQPPPASAPSTAPKPPTTQIVPVALPQTRRVEGLSSTITLPPQAVPRPATRDSLPDLTVGFEDASTDIRNIMALEALPDNDGAPKEADAGHVQRAPQQTLLDWVEAAPSSRNPEPFMQIADPVFIPQEPASQPMPISVPVANPLDSDLTADPSITRTWAAVKLPTQPPPLPPMPADDDGYEEIDPDALDDPDQPLQGITQSYDMRSFRESIKKE